jgi:site-specific recombinase XerD
MIRGMEAPAQASEMEIAPARSSQHDSQRRRRDANEQLRDELRAGGLATVYGERPETVDATAGCSDDVHDADVHELAVLGSSPSTSLRGEVVGGLARGELVDPRSLHARALEVACGQPAPGTRGTYAGVYRAFCARLGPEVGVEGLSAQSVGEWRDRLEALGRSPATIAKHLSALRTLADALGADPEIAKVRSQTVARGRPRALSKDEYARLLRMPDRRSARGQRDLALLYLLGTAGLRRSEVCALELCDIDRFGRSGDGRLSRAIARSTSWWVTVRCAERGRTRHVPLDEDALEAIIHWVKGRPVTGSEQLLLSLPRTGRAPSPLGARDIARIVARYAQAAGLADDLRSPNVLRHTFCNILANAGVDVGVIAELAGHADLRTTTIYTTIDESRPTEGVAAMRAGRGGRLAELVARARAA